MSDKEGKPRKVRRRRATGRVGGTTQSAFATNAMTSILQRQADDQARKKAKSDEETSDGKQDGGDDGNHDKKTDEGD